MKEHRLGKSNVTRMYDLSHSTDKLAAADPLSTLSPNNEQAQLRREASNILEQLFAGQDTDGGGGGGGGLVDDDEEHAAMKENETKKASRYLLYSTLDFPSLPTPSTTPTTTTVISSSPPSTVRSGAAASSSSAFSLLKVTHFVDASNIHAQFGFKGLEIALVTLGVFPSTATNNNQSSNDDEDNNNSGNSHRVVAYFTNSLWMKLTSAFPRRYNLSNPMFLVADASGDGLSQILNHMKVTNDDALADICIYCGTSQLFFSFFPFFFCFI
jgi:hypothetical protein